MANKKRNGRNTRDAKPRGEPFIQMPASFARELMRQATYDPNKSGSKKNHSYPLKYKEDVLSWLQNPSSTTSEKSLRDASNYMYLSSMHYNRLLNYYAGLYTGAYVIAPLGFNQNDISSNFAKQYYRVKKSLELMNIPHIMRFVTLVALRDGAFYGVIVSDNNSSIILKIDPDYCRITAICDNSYLYEVDMTKISRNLEFYPQVFTDMYLKYVETGERWQEVPIDISVCIKADETIPDYSIPPFAGVIPSLYTIANEEALQETASELRNYKMLSGQIPLDEKGNQLIPDDIVKQYYAHIASALDDRVGLALSPFKLESISFENNASVSNLNTLSDAVANFWSTAGTSGLLHGRENDTSGVTQLAIKNDETYVIGIIQQFERVINRHLKTNFSGSQKFKISILPITVFNRGELIKYYKEAASFGIGKSYYAAAVGVPQIDIAGMDYIERNFVPFDNLTPLKNSYTTSGDVGRPQEDLSELGDAGMETRDNDTNANRGGL